MRVIFIGTGEIGLPSLEWLLDPRNGQELVAVVAQPDKPVGRHQTLTPPPTKALALGHGISVLQPRRIREPEAIAGLAAMRPEVIVVMAYGQILPRAVLELPRLACLNLHASILPAHRGAAPIQAAVEAGDPESGITVIWMDEGLDTGDVLLSVPLSLDERETGGSLHDRLARLAPAALAEAFDQLATGRAARHPQESAKATYAPKLSRESGRIDWNASAAAIDRRVRAMNPWPAAYTLLGERRLKVFSAQPERDRDPSAAPGAVLRADERGILVAAGEGAVLLHEVQPEGKRRMSAADFLLGNPLKPGSRLG